MICWKLFKILIYVNTFLMTITKKKLQYLRTQLETAYIQLKESWKTWEEKTKEAEILHGEGSIRAQTVQIHYTIPILQGLAGVISAYSKYTAVLELKLGIFP